MAKSKAGYSAATSKDHAQVKMQYKNVIVLVVLIGIATFAQMKFESSFSTSIPEQTLIKE